MEFKKGHENFIKHLKEIGRPQTTVVAYSKDIEQLISHLEARSVENLLTVEFDNLNEFIESLRTNNYTLKSISRKAEGLNYADIVRACEEAIKSMIILAE